MQLSSTIMRLFANLSKDQKRLLLLEGLTMIICAPFFTFEAMQGLVTLGGAALLTVQALFFVFLLDFSFFVIVPYLWIISFPKRQIGPPSERARKGWTIKQKRKMFQMLTVAFSIIAALLYLGDMKLGASWVLMVALIFLAHMV